MAYAALISLDNTIQRTLNHHLFSISFEEKQQILSLLEHVSSFQGTLEEFPDKFNILEGRMRQLSHEAEDILEYFVLKKVSSSSDEKHELQLERVMGEIDLIAREVEKIEGSSSSKDVQRDDHSSSHRSSSLSLTASASDPPFLALSAHSWTKQLKSRFINTRFFPFLKNHRFQPALALEYVPPSVHSSSSNPSEPAIHKDVMVDFEGYVLHVKERLCAEESKLQVIPICGMGGIGKTTLAKNVYDDPLIRETFEIRVWITVSQDYTARRIFSSLLHTLKEFDTGRLGKMDEEKVYKILKCRRYLVVMDDIWSSETWDVVRNVFPDDINGSRVLLTTRLSDVASYPDSSSKICEIKLMDENQSWMLFKKKVFEDEDCPSELANIGWEIARSCGGLPLAIVVIAGVVSKVSRNLASWKEIAQNVKKSAEQNQIEDILALSFFHLPQYLRPCFLYMGSFIEDEEINVTKLIRLWIAEGFLKSPVDYDSFEKMAEECLEELVHRNLVLVTTWKCDGRIKSCSLHDMMRDLCIRKAHESKFFVNLTNRLHLEKKTFTESIKNHRRLSVNSSNLWHLSSSCGSTIHSIKCWPYFVVNMECFLESVKLLRVLDAASLGVQDFSLVKQVAQLFHLRYLAITYSGSDFSGLWNLQNLQTLIIHREEETVYEDEIDDGNLLWPWCMPQLRHVHYDGVIHFGNPEETTNSLGSLQTVSCLSHRSCTERTLKKIPNIKKLKVDISGCHHHGKATCLDDLIHLHRLESLELYVGEYRLKYYNFILPKILKKLTLSGLDLDRNNMIPVGLLPYLQVLKVERCNFIDGKWETTEGEFSHLKFLLLKECYYLSEWITESSHFPKLRRLVLHSCWCLNEIPNDIGEISTLESIEVNGYAPESLVTSVTEIQKEQEDLGNTTLQFICDNEWSRHERSDYDEFAVDDGYVYDDNDTVGANYGSCSE